MVVALLAGAAVTTPLASAEVPGATDRVAEASHRAPEPVAAPPERAPTESPSSAGTEAADDAPTPPTPGAAPAIGGPDPSAAAGSGTGFLSVVLEATPVGPQDFAFSACLDDACTPFSLDVDTGDFTLGNARNLIGLDAGTYVITQDAVAGWTTTSISCSPGQSIDLEARQATVDLADGQSITCFFRNETTALTVAVDDASGSGQDFTFSLCPVSGPCQQIVLDDDGDPTLSDRQWVEGLVPGEYTLTQEEVTGWGVFAISCGTEVDVAARSASFMLERGTDLTCTFRNRVNALVIVHDTATTSAQDFTYRACPDGGGDCVEFTLDDDNDPTLPATGGVFGAPAGTTYTITMTNPGGWGVPRRACSGDPAEVEAFEWVVTVVAGAQPQCRVTPTQTWVKIAIDPDGQESRDFSFTGCAGPGGANGCGAFALDNDGDATLPASQRFTDLTAGETYTITMDEVIGWGLVRITCTNGQVDLADRRVTIVVHAGEQVDCTFGTEVNSLRIVQDTAPDGPTDFTYLGCSGPGGAHGCGTFQLDDDSTDATLPASATYRELAAGTIYTVTQQAVGGFPLTGLTCSGGQVSLSAARVTIVLAPGDQVLCTFVNRTTSLRIVQDTDINDGQDMRFRGCAGPGGAYGCGDFLLDDAVSDTTLPSSVTYAGLAAGIEYSVVQEATPGYGLTDLNCTSGTVDLAARRATVVLEPGEQATCTFVNHATQLTIEVDVAPDNGVAVPFTGCAGPGGAYGCADFTLQESQQPTAAGRYRGLQAGVEYRVVQNEAVGIGLHSISCTNGLTAIAERRATVVLAAGEQVRCTFTSQVNRVSIEEDSIPANPQVFDYQLCGPTVDLCRPFSLADISDASPFDGNTTFSLLPAGPYTLTQAAVGNWALDELNCNSEGIDQANRQVTFHLDPGEGISCKFTNRPSAITVTADTVADAPRDLAFTLCPPGGAPCTAFSLDDDADATLANSRAFLPIDPGVYTVTQETTDPVMLTSISCSAGQTIDLAARRATLTVTPGSGLSCTFRNRVPSITVVHDTSPSSGSDFTYSFCAVATSVCSTVVLDDDGNATRSTSAAFADLAPGQYTVTQAAVSGHTLTSIGCHEGDTIDLPARRATVDLVAGEQTTCTFRST